MPCAQASTSCAGQPWGKPGHDAFFVAAGRSPTPRFSGQFIAENQETD
jgi:hypothetical protein